MGCGSSTSAGPESVASRSVTGKGRRVSSSGSSSSSSRSHSRRSGGYGNKEKPEITTNDANANRTDLDETGLEEGLVIPPSYETRDQRTEDDNKVQTEDPPKDDDEVPVPVICPPVIEEKEKDPELELELQEDADPHPVPCEQQEEEEQKPDTTTEEDAAPVPVVEEEAAPEPEPVPQEEEQEQEPEPVPQEQEAEPEPVPQEEEQEQEPVPQEEEAEPEPVPQEHEAEPEPEPCPPPVPEPCPDEEDGAPVPVPVLLSQTKDETDLLDTHMDGDSAEDYVDVGLGVKERDYDFRSRRDEPEVVRRPQCSPDSPYTDTGFTLENAVPADCQSGLEWKRPQEFLQNPQLFTEGTTRFDIGQGAAGTCWFLSMVANLSERPELLSRVIPEGSYEPFGSPNYDGVFHCKFYRFGEWLDIYIDDYLPIIYGEKPWGARSSTDPNEMWVSLLEKAFAHMHGSYGAVYGGQPGDAFLALTGGTSERIDFEEDDALDEMEIFQRVQNALSSKCLVTCVVPDKYDDVKGLVGGHAYSLNGTCTVTDNSGQQIRLMRVRNPWGHTEWKGAWSDGSDEWSTIPPGIVDSPNKDDGEFWICLQDFMVYFSQTTICSLTPDFDSDGCSDALDHKTCVFGEWKGETAAGFQKRLCCPKYLINIPEAGMMEDGSVPVVVQTVQKLDDRKKDEKISHRVDLYKVWDYREKAGEGATYVLEILGKKTHVFMKEKQVSSRYKVEPGPHLVVPTSLHPGEEGEFLVRVFTPAAMPTLSQVPQSAVIHSSDDLEPGFSKKRVLFGAWKTGVNAGGQVSHRDTFHTNPQYKVTVPDHGAAQEIQIVVMQEQKDPGFPIGIRIFTLDSGVSMPVDVDYLYDHYESSPQNMDGGQNKFLISTSVATKYSLPPGDYILLLHMDEPSQERSYSLVLQSRVSLDISEYNTA